MRQLIHFFVVLLVISQSIQVVYAQTCQEGYPESTPSSQFKVHSDGTVTDIKTGLMWKQCVQGFISKNCEYGGASYMTWSLALQQAAESSFAGYQDWRVPNIKELQSLVEEKCNNPAINLSIFPGGAFHLWSSSPKAINYTWGGAAWYVSFRYGNSHSNSHDDSMNVLLVRGGQ